MDDLKLIKDKYGERMMCFCRSAFSTILETPGLLYNLLETNFAFNKFLYDDIKEEGVQDNFKNYIYSLIDTNIEQEKTDKTPSQLLNKIGYKLYECKTEEDIQQFKKYYIKDEELCTFKDSRLNSCHVFFAVKDGAEYIKRSKNPKRQDEYGTSVISIQFARGDINTLSVKNRYNHSVNNPDATFSNNLENIIPGLSYSFEKEYGLNINQNNIKDFELSEYVKANDGKYYKYNYEIDNVYYCPNNIIIDDFEVIKDFEEKEKYLIIDYFIIDLVNKKVMLYDNIEDSFISTVKNIKKITLELNKETKNKIVKLINKQGNEILIEIDKTNKIVSYTNNSIEEINDRFLYYNESLENITMESVKKIGNSFCYKNKHMVNLFLPNVEEILDDFLFYNMCLKTINLSNVKTIENRFLFNNRNLKFLQMQNLNSVGICFLFSNRVLEILSLPSIKKISHKCLYINENLKEVYLPNVLYIGDDFLKYNNSLEEIYLPKVVEIGDGFLSKNKVLKNVFMDMLRKAGNEFLTCVRLIEILYFPSLEEIGWQFLYRNENLLDLIVPKLKEITNDILQNNFILRKKILNQLGYELDNSNKILIKK